MDEGRKIGAFCETYGSTIENCILEYLMENEELDIAVGDMAKELRISKPKAYEVIRKFEVKGFVNKSRIVGKTQLYLLNKENSRVKLFLHDLKECLRLVAEEYEKESLCLEPSDCKKGDFLVANVFKDNENILKKLLGGARNGS